MLPLALGLLAACAPSAEKLEITSPQGNTLRVRNEQVHLEVVATDREGRRVDPKLRWWSSAPDVVGVFEDGVVVAKRSGTARITAAAGGKVTATLDFTVAIPGAMEVRASGLDALETGRSTTLHATIKSDDGRLVTDIAPQWSSSDESVARIDGDKVLAVSPGSAVLTAQVGELKRRLKVLVVRSDFARLGLEPVRVTLDRPGQTAKLQVRSYDTAGRVIETPETHWFSSEPRVATVSPEGVVTGVAPGKVLISAQAGKRRASADVTVNAAPPPGKRR